MGLLIAQMRLIQIKNHRSDLEYKVSLISSTKMELSAQVNDIMGLGSDMDKDSPEMKALEKKKVRLQEAEKQLDMQLQRYQTQLQMYDAEEQQVKQQLQSSIQRMYS